MTQPNAITRITLGLVALTVCIVLVLDLALGMFPSEEMYIKEVRSSVSQNLAAQVASLIQAREPALIEQTMHALRARDPQIASIGLRRTDNVLIARTGDHASRWTAPSDGVSTVSAVSVPLLADGRPWGTLELAYEASTSGDLVRQILGPGIQVALALGVIGFIVFALYLRRVLQHLDPSQVVPERVRMAFDTLTEGVMIIDAEARIVLANAAACTLQADVDARSLVGKRLSDIDWLVDTEHSTRRGWDEAIVSRTPVLGRNLRIIRPNGGHRSVIANCAPVIDGRGSVRGAIVTFGDVTALEQAHEQMLEVMADLAVSKEELEARNGELQRLAMRDPLTGCMNRRGFFEIYGRLFLEAQRNGGQLACLMIDIDRFKSINDEFGHPAGDRIIERIGQVLSANLRQADVVCRYGGEEFCIVMTGLQCAAAASLAERLRQLIETAGDDFASWLQRPVTVSIGVAPLTSATPSPTSLIEAADRALYTAKNSGRNRVVTVDAADDAAFTNDRAAQAPAAPPSNDSPELQGRHQAKN